VTAHHPIKNISSGQNPNNFRHKTFEIQFPNHFGTGLDIPLCRISPQKHTATLSGTLPIKKIGK